MVSEHMEHMEHKEHMEPKLSEDIMGELDGACHYAKMAHHYKGKDEAMHRMYMEMAPQELSHAKKLFEKKVSEIEEMLR